RSRYRRRRRGARGGARARDPDRCAWRAVDRLLPVVAGRGDGVPEPRAVRGLTPPEDTGRHRGRRSPAEAALGPPPLRHTELTMSITAPIRPLYQAQTYRDLLFVTAAVPVAAIALGVVIAGWTSIAVLAITPLVVPVLLGYRGVVGLLARGDAALARSLL